MVTPSTRGVMVKEMKRGCQLLTDMNRSQSVMSPAAVALPQRSQSAPTPGSPMHAQQLWLRLFRPSRSLLAHLPSIAGQSHGAASVWFVVLQTTDDAAASAPSPLAVSASPALSSTEAAGAGANSGSGTTSSTAAATPTAAASRGSDTFYRFKCFLESKMGHFAGELQGAINAWCDRDAVTPGCARAC
jgi:hypothetical protein